MKSPFFFNPPSVPFFFLVCQAPAAGYEVFGPGQPPALCVSLELHRFADGGVTVLQQRGAVLPGEERAFAADLLRWARESGFKARLDSRIFGVVLIFHHVIPLQR